MAAATQAASPAALAQETATTTPSRRHEPTDLNQPDARAGETPPSTPPRMQHTARSAAGAPRPGGESGVAVEEPASLGARMLVVPRVALFLPRVALAVVNAPVRGGMWVYDRYEVRNRWYDVFYNDDRTLGIYPVVSIESDYGINVGGRFVYRDILGQDEFFTARASFGGSSSQLYTGRLESGERLGERVEVALEGEYDRRTRDPFYGVGNSDTFAAPDQALDPFGDLVVESRFGQTISRGAAIADVAIAGPLSLLATGAVIRKTFREGDEGRIGDDEQITDNYAVSELPGWDDGVSYVYGELELRYDSRRPASEYDLPVLPATGWLLAGFAGVANGFAREPTDYARYGVDLQRYLRLGARPRTLVLRGYFEGVAGETEDIPFVDLPRLGGPLLLRGYDRDRFRDDVAAMVSLEYQWDLVQNFAAFLFVDAGRVYPAIDELTLDDPRVSYGGGLQLHSETNFLARFTVGSSIDGGLVFQFSFDPVYDPKARVEKK